MRDFVVLRPRPLTHIGGGMVVKRPPLVGNVLPSWWQRALAICRLHRVPRWCRSHHRDLHAATRYRCRLEQRYFVYAPTPLQWGDGGGTSGCFATTTPGCVRRAQRCSRVGKSKMIQNCMFLFGDSPNGETLQAKLAGCGYTLNEPSRKLVLPISALTSTGLPDAAV